MAVAASGDDAEVLPQHPHVCIGVRVWRRCQEFTRKPQDPLGLVHYHQVMDFLLEGNGESFHVLNAVSPGFTCAMPFAAHVCDKVEGMLKSRS